MRKRGSVWLANLNPGRGTEPGKIRLVLIVQSQTLLEADHPSTLVVLLTSSLIDDAEPLAFACLRRQASIKTPTCCSINCVPLTTSG